LALTNRKQKTTKNYLSTIGQNFCSIMIPPVHTFAYNGLLIG